MATNKHWDIFCKIVDNFGDIGVCWRLARQLQKEHHLNIRLFIDDLNVAEQLIPALDTSLAQQTIQNITIVSWHTETTFTHAAQVVIESFACELPPSYLALMHPDTIWINLEYLSAETWVDDFHAKSSKRGQLTRHFFFPGFTTNTGGLLREHEIVKTKQESVNNQAHQQDFLKSLDLPANDDLKISLFCYPHAPIASLLTAMAASNQRVSCYVPASSILPSVANFFGQNAEQGLLHIGGQLTHHNLTVHVVPFLSQDDYDKLLSHCDINFVRGEDSWIRAIWAGKPFIWQPYLQTEQTHIKKLHAFLNLYFSECESTDIEAAFALHDAWQSEQVSSAIWQGYLNKLTALSTYSLQQSATYSQQTDLATKLVIFSEKMIKNIAENKV
ncbi:elongation factor P maturation arginine rhamnosyltransferase EarP [Methylotenera sp. L2L1]|uniref:elongation factor P maturation arginine rhamnosyltransferase EarP n=1 Tax=Methylotenera sp. L2L1 TaxID=1502770 RepID=UPI000560C462|nr:elongation factor P maturation arginine rhamnosyltransferase EarP [Methylotenera sp. L2L1]